MNEAYKKAEEFDKEYKYLKNKWVKWISLEDFSGSAVNPFFGCLDILDFMVLASSNFDARTYAKNINKRDVSDAWLSKIEQAYKKAELMFDAHPKFVKIKGIYEKVIEGKDAALKSRTRRRILWSGLVVGATAFLVFLIVVISTTSGKGKPVGRTDEDFLGQPLSIVVEYFENQHFRNIEIQKTYECPEGCGVGDVVSVEINGDFDFEADDRYKKKSQIIITYVIKDIYVSTSAKDLKGEDYKDVVEILKEMGFTNISVVEEKDVTLGWINQVGEVKSVSISGDEKFKSGDRFVSDEQVTVTYHGKK